MRLDVGLPKKPWDDRLCVEASMNGVQSEDWSFGLQRASQVGKHRLKGERAISGRPRPVQPHPLDLVEAVSGALNHELEVKQCRRRRRGNAGRKHADDCNPAILERGCPRATLSPDALFKAIDPAQLELLQGGRPVWRRFQLHVRHTDRPGDFPSPNMNHLSIGK